MRADVRCVRNGGRAGARLGLVCLVRASICAEGHCAVMAERAFSKGYHK